MTNAQFTYHKDKLAKWLLAAALVFSIFGFTGYGANSQSGCQHSARTELVISNNQKTYHRAIACEKAFQLINCNHFLIHAYGCWTNSLVGCSTLEKVKLKNISRQFCSYKSAVCFIQVNTVPSGSDEDVFFSFIG
jgi:hypothetical protein